MRTISEIYEALKQDFLEAAGRSVTECGDMSLRLMAVAAEIFTLEAQCEFVKRQAFPQTAIGEYLDMHAETRAIKRREAATAGGTLRFTLQSASGSNLSIPAGTECMNPAGDIFVTTMAGTIPAGQLSCEVSACARKEGEAGNAEAGSITRMRHAPAGVKAVTNPAAFSGGRNGESDDELRARVLASYRKLPNGANTAYYEALALSVPGVEKVMVLPRKRGRGTVDVVFSASYGYPDSTLVEQVRELIEQSREICVDVSVSAPKTTKVNVTAALGIEYGYSFDEVSARAKDAVAEYFSGGKLGESIYVSKIMSIIMDVDGVKNCHISSPAADIAAEAETLPVLGSMSFSEVQ